MGPIELIDVKPLPLPEHPYTREELSNYAQLYVECMKMPKAKALLLQERFTQYLERMPPWVQVLFIENRGTAEIGIRKHVRLSRSAGAQVYSNTHRILLLARDFQQKGDDAEYYLSHEVAHVIDNVLGQKLALNNDYGNLYRTEQEPRWIHAIKRDKGVGISRRPEDLNYQFKEFLNARDVDGKPIYKKPDYPTEAFAFVMSHYLLKCFRGEDQAQIDEAMQHHFPRMWPALNERILPKAMKLASEQYYHRREAEAENFNDAARDLHAALTRAADRHGFTMPDNPDFVANLATNYRVDWLHLFETLSVPLPETTGQRLTALFPEVFDPIYAASGEGRGRHKKPYLLSSFPHLRLAAEAFAKSAEDIVQEEGIEAFMAQYTHMWEAFEHAIENKVIKKRSL